MVEITSEDASRPIEHALTAHGDGWRAAGPGKQTVRLVFHEPQRISRIQVAFEETALERRQEFALSWSPDGAVPCRELLRQQWNFSPSGSTEETEDYSVELDGVKVLQLDIDPDGGKGGACATLKRLRIG